MKKYLNKIIIGISLFIVSGILYSLHYYLFHDSHHIFIYLLGDIAFLPIEVFLVSIVIENFISVREKKERFEKLNMVIETFFSEFGKELLIYLSRQDKNIAKIRAALLIKPGKSKHNIKVITRQIRTYKGNIEMEGINLSGLANYLKTKRGFLLRLLQNPNLLEHQSFTESLLAVFHITEELASRDLAALSPEDAKHLKIDIERAYNPIILHWCLYMEYIEAHYPYLFAFALRTNPFDEKNNSHVIA